ncbi:hypothetical protein [Vulgatibacter incomptus]|uniref:Uncharacterized protein n=1 Tax=Vulgatibacter incomptus TaxID=1391653 RepID=A0A0K1P9J6_9BACT|nr:hypothetical protein [Vulgatibacter incomptus]AKU90101.1 hypothetical protein AKJ08_0488 [Vulgatibacter incomptus]
MRFAGLAAAGLVALSVPPDSAKPEKEELWAGHELIIGARTVPILGTLETRTEIFEIARVVRTDDEIRLVQQKCKLEIARFAGVHVFFLPEGIPKMPPSTFAFRKKGDRWETDPWETTWSTEDVDGDGKPGATVTVDAPICGGTVYVGSRSRSIARGKLVDGGLRGELRASVSQKILETSGGCIGLVAKDTEEKVGGNFAYTPVPAGTTCETLLAKGWPIHADPPPRQEAQPSKPKDPKLRPR